MEISILVPTIFGRKKTFNELITKLKSNYTWTDLKFKSNEGEWNYFECAELGVNIISLKDNREMSIGRKRNLLLNASSNKYTVFCDDDDKVCDNYIQLLLEAAKSDCDCASLKGHYFVDGNFDGIFEHSIKYKKYKTTTNEVKYERFPLHLNLIRSSIAKQFKFPDKSFSEDTEWSTLINQSGLIKTEHYISDILYYYYFISNKKPNMSFSQNSEDSYIADYFSKKNTGKFIDIGAYHVEKFSNTRGLYLSGNWKGVFVEPAPSNWKAIADHYADDKEITVLNVAIGETSGEIEFYDCGGDAISTTDISHKERWEAAGVKYTKIKVPQLSVETFMNLYGKDCDMLSIDTESTNMQIFRNIPDWVFEQISLLVIEHDTCQSEIEEKLIPFGFETLYTNAENIVLAKS